MASIGVHIATDIFAVAWESNAWAFGFSFRLPIRRRFERSRRNFLGIYLPLADEWGLWDNEEPPVKKIAGSETDTLDQLLAIMNSSKFQEPTPPGLSSMDKIVLESSRIATEKMLAHYHRMGIKVTRQMTLAPDKKPRTSGRVKPREM